MRIEPDDLSRPAVHALLAEHLQDMHANSPAESVHALNLDGLRRPDIQVWTAWDGELLLGIGALRRLDVHHGELKSMRTPRALRRRGAGRALLVHILAEARRLGLQRVSLETGSGPAFEAAWSLYERAGFQRCGPFGDYKEDPFSVFMTRILEA